MWQLIVNAQMGGLLINARILINIFASPMEVVIVRVQPVVIKFSQIVFAFLDVLQIRVFEIVSIFAAPTEPVRKNVLDLILGYSQQTQLQN